MNTLTEQQLKIANERIDASECLKGFDKLWELAGMNEKLLEEKYCQETELDEIKQVCKIQIANLMDQETSLIDNLWNPIVKVYEQFGITDVPLSAKIDICTVVVASLLKSSGTRYVALHKPMVDSKQVLNVNGSELPLSAKDAFFMYEQNLYDIISELKSKGSIDIADLHGIFKDFVSRVMQSYTFGKDCDIFYELLQLMKHEIKEAAYSESIIDLSKAEGEVFHPQYLSQAMSEATVKLCRKDSKVPTALICDDRAARQFTLLEDFKFVDNYEEGDDGLIGYAFKQRMPVIKSRSLSYYTDPMFGAQILEDIVPNDESTDIGFFIAVYKNSALDMAPIIIGDYKAPFTTSEGTRYNEGHVLRHNISASYGIKSVSSNYASVCAFKVKKSPLISLVSK